MNEMMNVHEPPTRAMASAIRSPKPAPLEYDLVDVARDRLAVDGALQDPVLGSLRASGLRVSQRRGKFGNGFVSWSRSSSDSAWQPRLI